MKNYNSTTSIDVRAIARASLAIEAPGTYVLENLHVQVRVPFGPDTDGEVILPGGDQLLVYNTDGADVQWELYSSHWELLNWGSVLGLGSYEPSAWRDSAEEERLMALRSRWSSLDRCEDFDPRTDPWN